MTPEGVAPEGLAPEGLAPAGLAPEALGPYPLGPVGLGPAARSRGGPAFVDLPSGVGDRLAKLFWPCLVASPRPEVGFSVAAPLAGLGFSRGGLGE